MVHHSTLGWMEPSFRTTLFKRSLKLQGRSEFPEEGTSGLRSELSSTLETASILQILFKYEVFIRRDNGVERGSVEDGNVGRQPN
jgi:hypothetical protein